MSADWESTTLLAVLSIGRWAGANAEIRLAGVHQGAARGGAIAIAGALTPDKLLPLTVSDIASTRRIGLQGAWLDSAACLTIVLIPLVVSLIVSLVVALVLPLIVVLVPALIPSLVLVASTITLKTAALFARLVLSTNSRTNTNGFGAHRERSTASGSTVGCPETLAADKLSAISITNILLAGGVGNVLARRKIRCGLYGGDGH